MARARLTSRVNTRRRTTATLVGAAVSALVLASPAGAAGTASSPVITDRETVQVELSPTGKVDVARLFSQLTVSGDGHYVITDPTSAKAWRNLDGFAKPRFDGGNAVWSIDVHGKTARRSVSEVSSSALPVTVNASYTLNGKQMKPKDLVGKSGTLGVTWTIENVTATPTTISFTDGHGKPVSKTVDLVTPYVGQLSTVLPSSFRSIEAARADLAGDGHGGTQAIWTMVLFEPIGQTTQVFGYTAKVKHMTLPAATVQLVPVPPQRKPELKFGQDGFAEGAATGAELTDGATQIDANLIKLRDGAGQLLAGLGQLADGASQLKAGLAGKAAPGAKQLAAGTSTASAGALRLADGTNDLAAGATKLSAGLTTANTGSQKLLDGSQDLAAGAGLVAGGAPALVAGLGQISGGLAALNSATTGLPAAKAGAITLQAGVAALQAGVAQAVAGIGDAATSGTLLNGMAQISGGLGQLASPTAGLPAAKGGVDTVNAGLATAKTALQGLQAAVGGSAAEIAGVSTALGCPGSLNPLCPTLDSALNSAHGLNTVTLPTLGALVTGTTNAIGGLDQVSAGLGGAITGVGQLQGGASLVTGGLNQLKTGLKSGDPAHAGVTEGLALVKGGLDQLVAGLTAAVSGVGQLAPGAAAAYSGSQTLAGGAAAVADGAGQLADGAAQLADGTSQLDAGGKQLADGAGQAAAGAGQLSDGLKKIDAGSHDLSSGLTDAADGSGQLADGLAKAKDGGAQIADGTGRLQSEGTSKLVTAGEETTMSFGEKLARMKALDEKAADGALPFGAPAGGTGSAAYSYTLAAQTTEGHDSAVRAMLAVVLLGLTGALATIARRRVAAR